MRLNYKELKLGDVFYSGKSDHPMTVTKSPELHSLRVADGSSVVVHNTYSWEATRGDTAEPESFMITEGLEHYGPSIYAMPAYANNIKETTKQGE